MAAAAVVVAVPQSLGMCSVSGLVDLLNDEDVAVQSAAINGLLEFVDHHWHEVAEGLPTMYVNNEAARHTC